MAYVGIKLFRLFTKTANPKIQGMLAGVMFRPISFKTLLGLEAQYPYGPYCTWKYGHNPIFTQVMGVPFRLMIKSGIVGTYESRYHTPSGRTLAKNTSNALPACRHCPCLAAHCLLPLSLFFILPPRRSHRTGGPPSPAASRGHEHDEDRPSGRGAQIGNSHKHCVSTDTPTTLPQHRQPAINTLQQL